MVPSDATMPLPSVSTVRWVLFAVSPLAKVTLGSAPNLPVTFTFSELAPALVGVQLAAESLLEELHAARDRESAPAMATTLRIFDAVNFDTELLSDSGGRISPSLGDGPLGH